MLEKFNEHEKRVIFECVKAASEGPFFPDEEFHSLFGLERAALSAIVAAWPNIDDESDEVALAINNALVNLIGYPHGHKGEWPKYISVSPEEVARILEKLRGSA
jgi:hypothetical protein